ncbi:MAG: YIP1 family protein [Candidatus Aminicenantes bacterium]|nr:YIP1 family protein [Candidatus Aminicenantes bacterium]
MNLFKRIEGVFFNPRPVFDGLAAKPVWVDALIVVLVALIAFNLIVAPYMQKDQLRLMKDNAVLKERVGAERYDQMIQNMENPSARSRIIQTFVTTPLFTLIALLLQALVLLILGRFLSSQGTYAQVLSALLHASLVDKLFGNAVRMILALTRKSLMQTSTSLALLFPKMEVTSTSYIMLSQVDFFQLWMFGILAFGLAAVFKIELKKALFFSYGVWFLKALVNVGIAMIGMSFLR